MFHSHRHPSMSKNSTSNAYEQLPLHFPSTVLVLQFPLKSMQVTQLKRFQLGKILDKNFKKTIFITGFIDTYGTHSAINRVFLRIKHYYQLPLLWTTIPSKYKILTISHLTGMFTVALYRHSIFPRRITAFS